ncbi:MAG: hypothetical protein Q4A40_02840, partial [Bacillota bacterium]|nr:hypothetical protein [Bacillota bacterium]
MKKVAKAVSVFFFTFIMIIACFFMTGCTPSLLEVIGNYYELMGFEVEDISIDMYGKDCEVILTTDMSK